jgi:L-ribulose-5-phosphate 4-epimerase
MKNHGVFTIGPSAKAAVKSAVMCEDVARTVHIARQIGQPLPIAQSDVDG